MPHAVKFLTKHQVSKIDKSNDIIKKDYSVRAIHLVCIKKF